METNWRRNEMMFIEFLEKTIFVVNIFSFHLVLSLSP